MPKDSSKLSEFVVVETIGTGSFGTCRKVSRKSDGKVYVWKEVGYGGMTEKEKQLLVQEVNLLRELRHPHIVRYHDRIIDRSNSTLYIIMEYCEGGDLREIIRKCKQDKTHVEEYMVWKVLSQLLLALQECHKTRNGVHKVLHRDLKPANVFLDGSGNVKLGDFGLARILHHNFSLAQTFVGTPYYMSPEVFSEQAYDDKSDLWSLGCLLYELCTLSPPFTAKDQQTLATKVVQGRVGRLPQQYSTHLQSIVDSLLVTKPSHRPDIATLVQRVETLIRLWRESDKTTTTTTSTVSKELKISSRHELVLWESELQEKEQKLCLRELEVCGREREVERKEREIARREEALKRKETKVKNREEEVKRREKMVREWEKQLIRDKTRKAAVVEETRQKASAMRKEELKSHDKPVRRILGHRQEFNVTPVTF